MYSQILYPTDGSENAEAAFDHLESIALNHDATVHVLFIVDPGHVGSGMIAELSPDNISGMTGESSTGKQSGMRGSPEIPEETRRSLFEYGETVVDDVADDLGEVGTRTEVQVGADVYQKILDYADDHHVDLITMGTHGRRGVDHYLLGSVAEKVVRLSDAPVLTIRHSE